MRNCVVINLKKDEIIVRIAEQADHQEVIKCMEEKIPQLSKMYKEEKVPIFVTGKVLKEKELEEIKALIKKQIKVDIKFDSPMEMGLSEIRRVYERDTDTSETKYHKGSLRGGQKIEYEGSIVILGDVNGGAEVIAGENIIVVGALRGLAHASAKGNRKAIIAASSIETPQLRIANLLKEMEEEDKISRCACAYINEDKIVIE